MTQFTAKRFTTTRWATGIAGIALSGLILAGCAGSDPGSAPGSTEPFDNSNAQTELTVPRVAFTTNVQPTYVNTWYGPIAFGPSAGLNITENDFTVYESHSVAAQALLSKSADILGGSFIATALLRQEGQNLQVFCSFNNSDTMALIARNGITSVDELFDPNTRVATDSPGGAGSMVFNALLDALNAPGTVDDIPNQQILESSSLRANALAANQVDVAVIHIRQYNAAAAEIPDGVILATMADDVDDLVMQAFAAEESWLAENEETAINFCAAVIAGNRFLKSDYQAFLTAVDTYIDEAPDEAELKGIYDVVESADVWPSNGIPETAVKYTLDLGVSSGVLSAPLNPDDVVNRKILDAAVAKAGTLSN